MDLAAPQRLAGLAHLVAGRQQRDGELAPHRHLDEAQRRQQAQLGRAEAPARRQRDGAPRHILAGAAGVGAALDAGPDDHRLAVALAIFLHDHDVGAVGQDRAGEDACRKARRQRCRWIVAGCDAVNTAQRRGSRWIEIIEAHRIAVDRRIVVTRHGDRRGDVFRQDAAERLPQLHPFEAGDRGHALHDHGAGRIDAEQAAAESKAIVGKLRHASAPPNCRPERSEGPSRTINDSVARVRSFAALRTTDRQPPIPPLPPGP